MKRAAVCSALTIGLAMVCCGQGREVTSRQQLWLGYMTSFRFHARYSWWNDAHFVPKGFFIVRTGLTQHWDKISVSAGYAFLKIPVSSSVNELRRNEHRPWGQVSITLPLSPTVSFTHRIRYDARFRQEVIENMLQPGYSFVNRLRFFTGVRKILYRRDEHKQQFFVALGTEVLLNFGARATNTFDQFRLHLSGGMQVQNLQYQIGYMNRFVQTGDARYVSNHTLTLWVTHQIKK
jgi:hypothetical protein